MITREYKCKSCGYQFEEEVSIKDDIRSICPQCNSHLNQVYASNPTVLWFNDPRNGAITNRFKGSRRG